MYKIEPIESENLKLVPYTTNLFDYIFMLHKKNAFSIMDDYDMSSDEQFKHKMNDFLNTAGFGWICWAKKFSQKVGIIFYSHVSPGFSAIMHPILDKDGYRKYISLCNGEPRTAIMDEMTILANRYVMTKFNLVKITGGFFEHNTLAINQCKRLGFKEDGCLRNEAIQGGKLVNVKLLSLLREELI